MDKAKQVYTHIEKYGDHPLVEAIAGEIPIVGGLVSYWRGMIAARREREVDARLYEIQTELFTLYDELTRKVDVLHLQSPDFQETLAAVIEQSVRETNEEKRAYLKQFAINYALQERPSKIYKDIFFRLVENLNSLHINLLAYLYSYQSHLSEKELGVVLEQPQRREAITLNSIVNALKTDNVLVKTIILQMLSNGLLDVSESSTFNISHDTVIVLTPISKQFITFLKGEWKEKK